MEHKYLFFYNSFNFKLSRVFPLLHGTPFYPEEKKKTLENLEINLEKRAKEKQVFV